MEKWRRYSREEEGDFCPACWEVLEDWNEENPECGVCGARVTQPLSYTELQAERAEDARLFWAEVREDGLL